ncbi:hypothetical protein P0L94_02620 [Microbacter sp. GSS18]|nr:hypothetical protein P0L94_02620 [Microbacter sp. GSS18]
MTLFADTGIFEVAGLPAHPLLVHAVVVLIPLTVLALWLGTVWPAARRRLGIVTPAAAVAVLILVPITAAAGRALAEVVGPLPAVQRHQAFGQALLPWTIALFVVAAGQWAWFRYADARVRVRSRRWAHGVVIALGALAFAVGAGSLVMVVLVGDSGARAVWSGVVG